VNASGTNKLFGYLEGFLRSTRSSFPTSLVQAKNSIRVGMSYDFARIGLTGFKAFANYVHGELSENQHEDEIDTTVDYRIDRGPLKNFWLRLRYAHNSLSNQSTIEDYRVILNYTFAF
jgi:hypothetical protein